MGLALRAWRERSSLSANEVGVRMGCSQSTVSRMEAGEVGIDLLDLLRTNVPIEGLLEEAAAIAARDGIVWPGEGP
jgi:transcriptional regulator with XRE-family HTH domain